MAKQVYSIFSDRLDQVLITFTQQIASPEADLLQSRGIIEM